MPSNELSYPSLVLLLPGPDRRRQLTAYHYRLTYRAAEDEQDGCVMTWEVHGGRSAYQLAVERKPQGQLDFHCTCADAVYRGEELGHVCKHVEGFLRLGTEMTGVAA